MLRAPGHSLILHFFAVVSLGTTVTLAATRVQSAARPPLKAINFIELLERIEFVDLEQLRENQRTGWSAEGAELRELALTQAKAYTSYRRAGKAAAQSGFVSRCLEDPSSNVFCEIEKQRLGVRFVRSENLVATKARAADRSTIKEIEADLKAANIDDLARVDRPVLARALSNIDDFAALEKVARGLIKKSSCESAPVAISLALKAEEFFPENRIVQLTKQLYETTLKCEKPDPSAVFRASLLAIWQGNCRGVDEKLALVLSDPSADFMYARARFWRYHCAQQLKNRELASQMAAELGKFHPMSFQNLLVNGGDLSTQIGLHESPRPRVLFRSILNPELNRFARAIEALFELGEKDLVLESLDVISPLIMSGESGFRLYFAALSERLDSSLALFKNLATLLRDQPELRLSETLKMMFPLHHFSAIRKGHADLDPYLVTALIRQESAFNRRAQSVAGARGLMQLMPATARQLGAKTSSVLYDPQINIRIGSRYFSRFLRTYGGDIELSLAAYNAGFNRVDNWLKRYPAENRLLFLELMPYRETRDYVANILRNYYWYVRLYADEPLAKRLERLARDPGLPHRLVSLGTQLGTQAGTQLSEAAQK